MNDLLTALGLAVLCLLAIRALIVVVDLVGPFVGRLYVFLVTDTARLQALKRERSA